MQSLMLWVQTKRKSVIWKSCQFKKWFWTVMLMEWSKPKQHKMCSLGKRNKPMPSCRSIIWTIAMSQSLLDVQFRSETTNEIETWLDKWTVGNGILIGITAVKNVSKESIIEEIKQKRVRTTNICSKLPNIHSCIIFRTRRTHLSLQVLEFQNVHVPSTAVHAIRLQGLVTEETIVTDLKAFFWFCAETRILLKKHCLIWCTYRL